MEEKVYSAKITSKGMYNVLKRARQLTELEWIPLEGSIPGVTRTNGEITYFYHEKGKKYKGIPYSSVYETNTYVGSNISIETFISATCDPRSYLYTRDLRKECKEPKAVPFYGMVCSKFAQYAFGIDETYNTQHFFNIDGMKKMFSSGGYSLKELERCDVLLNPKHTALITDILSDENGEIKYIEVSEETTIPCMLRKRWGIEEFFEKFGNYDIYRYEYLEKAEYIHSDFVNVFDEAFPLDNRKYDILTKYGDKCNINLSENKRIDFDIITSEWKKCTLYLDEQIIAEIDISGKDEFSFYPEKQGYYKAVLFNENKISRPCYFCVFDFDISVKEENGIVIVEYGAHCGEICWMKFGANRDSIFIRPEKKGIEKIEKSKYPITENKIAIAFKNEYGIFVSRQYEF